MSGTPQTNKKTLKLLLLITTTLLLTLLPSTNAQSNVLGNPVYTAVCDNGAAYLLATVYIAPITGTVTSCHFYVSGAFGHHAVFGVYDNATGNLLFDSGIIDLSFDGWQNITSSFQVTAGSAYRLAIQTDDAGALYHFIDGIGELMYVSRAFAALPSPFPAYSEIARTTCAYCIITPISTAAPTAEPPITTGAIDILGFAILGFFSLLGVFFIARPFRWLNIPIGVFIIAVSAALALAGYFGSFWILTLFGAVIGIVCLLRATDLI